MAENDDAMAALNGESEPPAAAEVPDLEPTPQTAGPAYMGGRYDWVEKSVQDTWLANAAPAKVVADALSRIPEDSDEEHAVNVVRRAYHAHRNRPTSE